MSTIFDPVPASSIGGRFARDDRASGAAIVAGISVSLVSQAALVFLGLGVGAVGPVWVGVSALIASLLGGFVAGRLCGATNRYTARWHGLVSFCATAVVALGVLSIVGASTGLGSATSSAWHEMALVHATEMQGDAARAGLNLCLALLMGAVAGFVGGGLGAPTIEEF